MDLTIDELTALVFQHSRRAIQARKAAAETLKLAAEDDRLAQVYLEVGKRRNREREAKEGKMNIRKIISGVMVLVLMLCLLSVSSFTLAQDEPGATAEVTINGQPVEATLVPIPDDTQVPVTAGKDNTALILETAKELLYIVALLILAFKLAGLVSADVMDKALARGFELARGLANTTDTPVDNWVLEKSEPFVRKIIADELAKQNAVQNTLQSKPNTVSVTMPSLSSVQATFPPDIISKGGA